MNDFNFPAQDQYNIKDPLVILGNGPSLANVDFDMVREFDSVGFNAAYREFERIGFWPKYYATFDHIQGLALKDGFEKLITQQVPNDIRGFFVPYTARDLREFAVFDNVHVIPIYRGGGDIQKYPKPTHLKPAFDNLHWVGPGGTMMAEMAMCMGYTKIILLGVDSRLIKYDNLEPVEYGDTERCVRHVNPKECNHWFDDYLKDGDVVWYGRQTHEQKQRHATSGWTKLKKYADANGIHIVNGNPDSAVKDFPMMPWREALAYFD